MVMMGRGVGQAHGIPCAGRYVYGRIVERIPMHVLAML